MSRRLVSGLVCAGMACAPSAVVAQNPGSDGGFQPAGRSAAVDPKVPDTLDTKDGKLFQPKGFEVGSFLFLPRVDAATTWNTNVYASPRARGDLMAVVRPEMKLRSRFDTHAVNLTAGVEATKFNRFDTEDRVDADIQVDGRYDLSSNSELNALSLANFGHEDRSSPDDAGGKEPTPTRTYDNRIGGATRLPNAAFSGSFDILRNEFDNVAKSSGGMTTASKRDRTEFTGTVKGGYEFVRNYSAELELIGNVRDYDSTLDASGYKRDSHGYRVHGGLGVEVSDLLRGDLLVGWMQQDYEDERLKTVRGPSARMALNWTPTRLLLVVPSIERSVQETTKVGSAGYIRNNGSLTVRWEYLPDVLITNTLALNFDQYQGITGNDAYSIEDKLRVMHALTQQFHVGVSLAWQRKLSEASDTSFSQAKAGLTASLQF